ncbi:hypothetical protein GGI18_005921, partial [Coemansia linderi]
GLSPRTALGPTPNPMRHRSRRPLSAIPFVTAPPTSPALSSPRLLALAKRLCACLSNSIDFTAL